MILSSHADYLNLLFIFVLQRSFFSMHRRRFCRRCYFSLCHAFFLLLRISYPILFPATPFKRLNESPELIFLRKNPMEFSLVCTSGFVNGTIRLIIAIEPELNPVFITKVPKISASARPVESLLQFIQRVLSINRQQLQQFLCICFIKAIEVFIFVISDPWDQPIAEVLSFDRQLPVFQICPHKSTQLLRFVCT